MVLHIFNDKRALAKAAARDAAATLREAIASRGSARLIAATGVSQFEFLDTLIASGGIDWSRVEMFHLDEYIGLPISHPASFRKYLLDRLIHKAGITKYHLLDGDGNVEEVILRVGQELASAPVDVAFVGIGENGHLAFNDPPADFETEEPFLVVDLDDACRRQQVGESWFADLSEVPRQAITMSMRQILKSKKILAIVPDARKAKAVKACMEGEISPLVPASLLRTHPDTTLFLDEQSAALLSPETRPRATRESGM
jgi:glucosamine-6-phosphate deaminase